jgi:carbamoyl-phosphate synthase large subunit
MLNIAVTGTGSLVGQAIIKCIKASTAYNNSVIYGIDYVADTVGSYWVNHNFLLPDITKSEVTYEQAVNALIPFLIEKKIAILFIGIDFDLPMYAKYKTKIEQAANVKIIVSSENVIKIADDKFETFKFLEQYSFTRPSSYLFPNIPENLHYPMIIKPCTGASSKGVSKVNNREEAFEKAVHLQKPILQELIGDDESEYTCGVVYLEGKLIDVIVLKRKLKKGDTFKAIHQPNFPPNIYEYIKQLCEVLQPNGSCNFQLRLDSNGVPKLFEINARHSGTTYFRCLFGFNEVELILQHYFPSISYSKPTLKYGMAMRFFDEKLMETY